MAKTAFRELAHSMAAHKDLHIQFRGEQRDIQNKEGLTGISLC